MLCSSVRVNRAFKTLIKHFSMWQLDLDNYVGFVSQSLVASDEADSFA